METIVTLTINPAIDGAAEAEQVRPIRKVRTWGERYDPGGGGINASRVIKELGGSSLAIYLSGGCTGPVLDGLVRRPVSRACAYRLPAIPGSATRSMSIRAARNTDSAI